MTGGGRRKGDLNGRHALVTGGGSGIGRAIALALDAAGATVSVIGRREAPLKETLDGCANTGGFALADVTDEKAVQAAVQSRIDAEGPVSILVNNAGAAETAPFSKTSLDVWQGMLAVNMTAAFLVTKAVLPAMKDLETARIINVASTASLKGYPYVSAYVAAKHGLLGLTRALALELAKSGVTVNAICPGFTETDLLERSVANIVEKTGMSDGTARGELAANNPQGRLITPDEVAGTALWLCSESASGITGQAITIAGGEIM